MTTAGRPLVGVLGGMGPLATADFYTKVIRLTPATVDQDHVRMVIWADPTTPDRSAALLDHDTSPLTALTRGVSSLATAGADLIAIPCNTAHAYLHELRQASTVTILDMIELTVAHAKQAHPELSRLGVLATRGTHATRLYERRATDLGLDVVLLDGEHQRHLTDRAIAMVKNGHDLHEASELIRTAAVSLLAQGAQAVVAGCTEIPLISGPAAGVLPIVDPTSVLAQAVVDLGTRGGLSGPTIPCAAGA